MKIVVKLLGNNNGIIIVRVKIIYLTLFPNDIYI